MYSYIVHPHTNERVSINHPVGKQLIIKYLNTLIGGTGTGNSGSYAMARQLFPSRVEKFERGIAKANSKISSLHNGQQVFHRSRRYLQFKKFWPEALQALENTSPEFKYSKRYDRPFKRRLHLLVKNRPTNYGARGNGRYFNYKSTRLPLAFARNVVKALWSDFKSIINIEDVYVEELRRQTKRIDILQEKLEDLIRLVPKKARLVKL